MSFKGKKNTLFQNYISGFWYFESLDFRNIDLLGLKHSGLWHSGLHLGGLWLIPQCLFANENQREWPFAPKSAGLCFPSLEEAFCLLPTFAGSPIQPSRSGPSWWQPRLLQSAALLAPCETGRLWVPCSVIAHHLNTARIIPAWSRQPKCRYSASFFILCRNASTCAQLPDSRDWRQAPGFLWGALPPVGMFLTNVSRVVLSCLPDPVSTLAWQTASVMS